MKEYDFTRGIELIKKYEGCVLKAYKCPAGVWTIGYGHTKDVKQGMTITQAKADKYLEEDCLAIYNSAKFRSFCEIYDLNNNQACAMLSFCFNGGLGWLAQVSKDYTRDVVTIGEKMLLYNKANGVVLNGLVRRRKEESDLFFSPVLDVAPVITEENLPSAYMIVTFYDKNGKEKSSYKLDL